MCFILSLTAWGPATVSNGGIASAFLMKTASCVCGPDLSVTFHFEEHLSSKPRGAELCIEPAVNYSIYGMISVGLQGACQWLNCLVDLNSKCIKM